MSFFEAVRLAWNTIRVQKLKSFFTVLGVTIGVTFLIAVVSIVGGMSRYMEDDLVGKLIAVNSFEPAHAPELPDGRRRPRRSGASGAAARASWIPTSRRSPPRCRPDVLWAVESSDNLNVESRYVQAAHGRSASPCRED